MHQDVLVLQLAQVSAQSTIAMPLILCLYDVIVNIRRQYERIIGPDYSPKQNSFGVKVKIAEKTSTTPGVMAPR